MTETKTAAPPDPKPGNLSTRQLAESLLKTSAAEPPETGEETPEETAPEEEPQETTREVSPAEGGGEPAEEPQSDTETEEPGVDAGEETEPTAEQPQPPPAPGALPAELADAIELAKGEGKVGVAKLLKRVHSLVDDRDTERNARLTAAEENKQLRAELQEARARKTEAKGTENSWTHPEVAAVQAELGNVDHWLAWCEANPDGGEVPDGKNGTMELTAKDVAGVHRDLQNQRQELVARKVQTEAQFKAAYTVAQKQFHDMALAEFPWMKNPASPEHKDMEAVLQAFPAFKMAPDYELAIGDYLAGKKLREARAAGRSNGVRKAPAARSPTKVMAEPPGGQRRDNNPIEKEKKEAENKFRSTGRVADLAATFAANRRASRK